MIQVAQKRQRQIKIWADITKKERELLTLVKVKQTNAEEKKKKKQEIYDLITVDSETDVSIKTYEEDKSKNILYTLLWFINSF